MGGEVYWLALAGSIPIAPKLPCPPVACDGSLNRFHPRLPGLGPPPVLRIDSDSACIGCCFATLGGERAEALGGGISFDRESCDRP